jgi:hypothetical protein
MTNEREPVCSEACIAQLENRRSYGYARAWGYFFLFFLLFLLILAAFSAWDCGAGTWCARPQWTRVVYRTSS